MLAEPDPHAPFRQEFDESLEMAGAHYCSEKVDYAHNVQESQSRASCAECSLLTLSCWLWTTAPLNSQSLRTGLARRIKMSRKSHESNILSGNMLRGPNFTAPQDQPTQLLGEAGTLRLRCEKHYLPFFCRWHLDPNILFKVVEMPEGAAVRVGWAQKNANLQVNSQSSWEYFILTYWIKGAPGLWQIRI